jgi:Rrf2 family cysteine metabolism transcriptional repressor
MRLTTRSEYALLALVDIARDRSGGYVPVGAIAKRQGIPAKYLEQILLALKRSSHLRSAKGHRGGYTLARPAADITLAEIVRLMDGALAPTDSVSTYFYEPTPISREKAVTRVFKDIRDYVARKLETTTLADVA